MVRFLTFSLCLLASAIVTSQASAQVNVTVQNQQRQTIYVAFTLGAGQVPGPINWGNCAASHATSVTAAPASCGAWPSL